MTTSTERAVLAGSCFWGMQDLFRRYPGVISTRVGYAGSGDRSRSGRRLLGGRPSIRTTLNVIRLATTVISSGPTGSSPSEKAPPQSKRSCDRLDQGASQRYRQHHRPIDSTSL
jgi:hypothetical protein